MKKLTSLQINKFSLKYIEDNLDLHIVLLDHLQNTKKKKHLKKH